MKSCIDCPEIGQAYGTPVKQFTSVFVLGKGVILLTHGQDKYGRILGDVFLLDGTHVNHTLVKDGWCWRYRKYAPADMVLEGLENEARETRIGRRADRTKSDFFSESFRFPSKFRHIDHYHAELIKVFG